MGMPLPCCFSMAIHLPCFCSMAACSGDVSTKICGDGDGVPEGSIPVGVMSPLQGMLDDKAMQ
jgi:hypothetical protein